MRSVYFPLFWRATGLTNLMESCDPDKLMGNKQYAPLLHWIKINKLLHSHAQCVFPPVLTGHKSYKSHGILWPREIYGN